MKVMKQFLVHLLFNVKEPLLGAVTSMGVGYFFLKIGSAILLGVMGALGGYLFSKFIKPRLDKLFKKKKD